MVLPHLARLLTRNSSNQIDNEWQGDEIETLKESHITRLMFHNVNGLSIRGVEGFDIFANEQANLQVDIQGFSEHCLDTTKFQVYQRTQDILRQNFQGQSSLVLTSSEEAAPNLYKPGGTGILVLGDTVSRQETQGKGSDKLGRWSYLHLRRKHLPPVTIISAYQVCTRPTNPLGNTAYHQQLRALHTSGHNNIHPCQAFIRDLGSFLDTLQSNRHDLYSEATLMRHLKTEIRGY